MAAAGVVAVETVAMAAILCTAGLGGRWGPDSERAAVLPRVLHAAGLQGRWGPDSEPDAP